MAHPTTEGIVRPGPNAGHGDAPSRAEIRRDVMQAVDHLHRAMKIAEESGLSITLKVSSSGRWVSAWLPLDQGGD